MSLITCAVPSTYRLHLVAKDIVCDLLVCSTRTKSSELCLFGERGRMTVPALVCKEI